MLDLMCVVIGKNDVECGGLEKVVEVVDIGLLVVKEDWLVDCI